MRTTITLCKVVNDKLEEIITFQNNPHVYEFFNMRGFLKNSPKSIKLINVHMLKKSLHDSLKDQHNDKSKVAYDNLMYALDHKINKDDDLMLTYQ